MPQVEKNVEIEGTLAEVWAWCEDVGSFLLLIPGCESVRTVADGEYETVISVSVGAFRSRFTVQVRREVEAPGKSLVFVIVGRDPTTRSSVNGRLRVHFSEADGRTCVRLTGNVDVHGPLGSFGWGVVVRKADELFEQFLSNVRGSFLPGRG